MYVGEKDWQCPPDRIVQFEDAIAGACTVVRDKGHDLGKGYMSLF
jgi:hypothetical protein